LVRRGFPAPAAPGHAGNAGEPGQPDRAQFEPRRYPAGGNYRSQGDRLVGPAPAPAQAGSAGPRLGDAAVPGSAARRKIRATPARPNHPCGTLTFRQSRTSSSVFHGSMRFTARPIVRYSLAHWRVVEDSFVFPPDEFPPDGAWNGEDP